MHYLVQDQRNNIIGQFSGTSVEQKLTYGILGSLGSVSTATGDTIDLQWKGLVWDGRAIYTTCEGAGMTRTSTGSFRRTPLARG